MSKLSSIHFLLPHLRRHKRHALTALALMFLVAASRMAPPYILKLAIDRYIARADFQGLSIMALLYLLFIFGGYVATYFQIYATQLFGQSVVTDMRASTFDHILRLPVRYFDRTPRGKNLHYLTSDMENINEFISFTVTDRGVEGYAYYYGRAPRGRQPHAEAAGPLSLLEHVGGRPIAAMVGRTRFTLDDYDLLAKWVKVAHGYFKEYAVPTMRGRDREEYDKIVAMFQPIVARFDKTNRELLIPSLGAGQCGVVLDAKLALRTIHSELPTFEKPMPMVEPAIVLGVSDAAKFREAMDEYRRIANDAIAALHEIAPHDVPEFKIPEPKARRTTGGTLYRCSLPEEWGVTAEIAPTLGLSDTVAAFAISEKHAERLLKAAPVRLGGLLAQPRRSLAAAGGFDFAGLIDAATPWIELAVREAIKENPGFLDSLPAGDADKSKEQVLFDQVHTALKALKTIRAITSESYVEGGALVTHTLLEVRDVE